MSYFSLIRSFIHARCNTNETEIISLILLQHVLCFHMSQEYRYVSRKTQLNILPCQFNYLLHFKDRKNDRERIPPVQQNLMKLTCLLEMQFYG